MSTAAALAAPPAPARPASTPPAPAPAGDEPANRLPMRVSFRLADGVRVTGELTAFDDEGIDGSFGRRRWRDLDVDEAWKLRQRLMDRDDPAAWVELGALMLELEGGERYADRAFARAERGDPELAKRVDVVRAEAAARRAEQQRLREQLEAERLTTATPEAADWPAMPWTGLTPDALDAAVLEVHEQAKAILAGAGLQLVPIRAEHFLVYSDLEREAAAALARQLDLLYGDVAELLGVPTGCELFHGKAVVLILANREPFRLIEAQAFGYLVQRDCNGVCHFRGPDVFVNVLHVPDERAFASTLFREAVHGIMHRYGSPKRLPPWANEGLPLVVMEARLPGPTPARTPRDVALAYIRDGRPVDALLAMSYADPAWPGRDGVGPAVGALAVELMIRERPAAFVRWVNAIKGGKDWTSALEEDYGATPAALVAAVEKYYAVND